MGSVHGKCIFYLEFKLLLPWTPSDLSAITMDSLSVVRAKVNLLTAQEFGSLLEILTIERNLKIDQLLYEI